MDAVFNSVMTEADAESVLFANFLDSVVAPELYIGQPNDVKVGLGLEFRKYEAMVFSSYAAAGKLFNNSIKTPFAGEANFMRNATVYTQFVHNYVSRFGDRVNSIVDAQTDLATAAGVFKALGGFGVAGMATTRVLQEQTIQTIKTYHGTAESRLGLTYHGDTKTKINNTTNPRTP